MKPEIDPTQTYSPEDLKKVGEKMSDADKKMFLAQSSQIAGNALYVVFHTIHCNSHIQCDIVVGDEKFMLTFTKVKPGYE